MSIKKWFTLLLCAVMVMAPVGCTGKPATLADAEDVQISRPAVPGNGEVKTGLAVSAALSSSRAASAEENGVIQTDVTIAAVAVTADGVITACTVDAVQAKIAFDAEGRLTDGISTAIASKNELGAKYGMGKYSAIGREWSEQAAALADYAVGKTIGEIQGIAVNEETRPTDADLSASVTIAIGGMIDTIAEAVSNAEYLGAQSGDELKIVTTGVFSAPDLAEGESAAVQTDVNIAAVTMDQDIITSCLIDAVQTKGAVDAAGHLLTDVSAPVLSKNQLGTDYGMGKYSAIGREWNEQASAFAAYITGKTVDDVLSIAVNEETRPASVDLSSSVTIAVGGFQTLIGKLR